MSHHFLGKTYDLTQANFQKVIQELEAVTAAHEELLSYLPKIPTESYEKRLALTNKELREEIARLEESGFGMKVRAQGLYERDKRIRDLEECLKEVIRNSYDIVAKKLCSRTLHGHE